MVFQSNEIQTRIQGGSEAGDHEFPWHVFIEITHKSGDVSYCGGALISDVDVVTAASCIAGQ